MIFFFQQKKGKTNENTHNEVLDFFSFLLLVSSAVNRLVWNSEMKAMSECEITAPSQYAAPLEFHFSDVAHFGNYKTMAQVTVWVYSESFFFSGFDEAIWTRWKLQTKNSNLR